MLAAYNRVSIIVDNTYKEKKKENEKKHNVLCNDGPCRGIDVECKRYCIAVNGSIPISMAQLQSVTCHMGSHSVTCYPTQVNTPALTQAIQAGTRFTYRGGMEG